MHAIMLPGCLSFSSQSTQLKPGSPGGFVLFFPVFVLFCFVLFWFQLPSAEIRRQHLVSINKVSLVIVSCCHELTDGIGASYT